jgi:hypothetical protein
MKLRVPVTLRESVRTSEKARSLRECSNVLSFT